MACCSPATQHPCHQARTLESNPPPTTTTTFLQVAFLSIEYSDLTLMSLLSHSLHALPVLQVHTIKVRNAPEQLASSLSITCLQSFICHMSAPVQSNWPCHGAAAGEEVPIPWCPPAGAAGAVSEQSPGEEGKREAHFGPGATPDQSSSVALLAPAADSTAVDISNGEAPAASTVHMSHCQV